MFQPLVDNPRGKDRVARLVEHVCVHSLRTDTLGEITNQSLSRVLRVALFRHSAGQQCPGLLPYTKLACSGHGRCNAVCGCECELAPSVLQACQRWGGRLRQLQLGGFAVERCPGAKLPVLGFDGYDHQHGCAVVLPTNVVRGGTCACDPGESGDACQFSCPMDQNGVECSGHGGCGTKAFEMDDYVYTSDAYTNRIVALNRTELLRSSCFLLQKLPRTQLLSNGGRAL